MIKLYITSLAAGFLYFYFFVVTVGEIGGISVGQHLINLATK